MLTYFLLIGIFVAILFLIRTTVKKAANAAFEREVIEKEGFKFVKEEGYLNPINDKFEAYSRDFIEGGNLRKSWLEITESESLRKPMQNSGKRNENGVEIESFFKTIANKSLGKTFTLEISVVKEHKDEFIGRINRMLENFEVR
jgi:hypothetical protein